MANNNKDKSFTEKVNDGADKAMEVGMAAVTVAGVGMLAVVYGSLFAKVGGQVAKRVAPKETTLTVTEKFENAKVARRATWSKVVGIDEKGNEAEFDLPTSHPSMKTIFDKIAVGKTYTYKDAGSSLECVEVKKGPFTPKVK